VLLFRENLIANLFPLSDLRHIKHKDIRRRDFVIYLPIGKDLFSAQFFAFAATRRPFPRGIISRFSS